MRKKNWRIVVSNFFGEGEHLYDGQLGWTMSEKREARSFVHKEIFLFEIGLVGFNMAFYHVDDDTFYGIHTESSPIEVKVLPRDRERSPYPNEQCTGDTHEAGNVLFTCENAEELWERLRIGGKSLENVLERSLIITLD